MSTTFENPMGTDGFEFLEYSGPDIERLAQDFKNLGFTPVAKHKSKDITLYRQGDINFLLNAEKQSHAATFQQQHGPCASAMGFRVKDAHSAFERAVSLGATPADSNVVRAFDCPAIKGIGDSLLYFIDTYGDETIYDNDFEFFASTEQEGLGLQYIDHVTHNVYKGNMNKWASYYEDLFNFREIRFFDIKGEHTGLLSRAMTSPCGKIRIPINEATDEQSQIAEYLRDYDGEGIQHIALHTDTIYDAVEDLRERKINFLDVPDTYYEMIEERINWHQEDVPRLQTNSILIDGTPTEEGGLLLQIFTQNMLGPIFFEIIQRKGNDGFGEGNFQALFESIERDQIRRGVINNNEDETA